jgi:hypothetical protein
MPLKKPSLELDSKVDLHLLGKNLKYTIERETNNNPFVIVEQIYKADPEKYYVHYYATLYYLENND